MRAVLFALFVLFISFFSLVTDPGFTFLLLDEKAVPATQQYLEYLRFQDSMPDLFNEKESSHMADVAWLIRSAFVFLVLISIALWKKGLDYKSVKNGFIILASFIIICALIPFDTLFTYFHYVFFPQGNWQFAQESTLITFYPASFFFYYAIAIALNAVGIAFTAVVACYLHRHKC